MSTCGRKFGWLTLRHCSPSVKHFLKNSRGTARSCNLISSPDARNGIPQTLRLLSRLAGRCWKNYFRCPRSRPSHGPACANVRHSFDGIGFDGRAIRPACGLPCFSVVTTFSYAIPLKSPSTLSLVVVVARSSSSPFSYAMLCFACTATKRRQEGRPSRSLHRDRLLWLDFEASGSRATMLILHRRKAGTGTTCNAR